MRHIRFSFAGVLVSVLLPGCFADAPNVSGSGDDTTGTTGTTDASDSNTTTDSATATATTTTSDGTTSGGTTTDPTDTATGGTTGGGCPLGTISCGTECIDPAVNPDHCGMCDNACGDTQACNNGACVNGCPAGTMDCSGSCVDTQNDGENCGTCGEICGDGLFCSEGMCAASCAGGLMECGGDCVDVSNNKMNCGSCGVTCGVEEACISGNCEDLNALAQLNVEDQWLDPTGWLDPDGNPIRATFTAVNVPGAIFECRTGKPGAIGNMAFVPCDGVNGDGAWYEPGPSGPEDEGMYVTQARVRVGGFTSDTVEWDYYVHLSLNDVDLCPNSFTDADIFNVAVNYVGGAPAFDPNATALRNPFINLRFDNPYVDGNMLGGDTTGKWSAVNIAGFMEVPVDSLRRRFVLSADGTMLLIHRRRVGRRAAGYDETNNLCRNGFRFGNNHYLTPGISRGVVDCQYFVLNSEGAGVCLYDNNGALALRLVSNVGYVKVQRLGQFSVKGAAPNCDVNKWNSACTWYLHLPQ